MLQEVNLGSFCFVYFLYKIAWICSLSELGLMRIWRADMYSRSDYKPLTVHVRCIQ